VKKGILIAGSVVALLAVMIWADHKFPPPGAPKSNGPAAQKDAPTVVLKDLSDKDVTLAQYKGQVVLVNFWATWCDPCRAEIPLLIDLQKKYSSRGFTILGASMDEEGKKVVQPFLDKQRFDVNGQKEPMNYPILLANDTIAEKFGGVLGLPTSMLYTRDGKESRRIVGPVKADEISKAIEGLL
jgi:thiol-disulfide isomerase/thioredoxin